MRDQVREIRVPWSDQLVRLRPPARRVLAVAAGPEEFVAWAWPEGMVVEGRLRIEVF